MSESRHGGLALGGAGSAHAQGLAPLPEPLPTTPGTFEPAAESEVVRSLADAREAVDADAVNFYTERFGVSSEEARTRLGRQVMVSNLENRLAAARPTSLWFDNQTGRWVVAVRQEQRQQVASKLDDLGLGDHARIEVVEASLRDRKLVRDRLNKELSDRLEIVALDEAGLEVLVRPTRRLVTAQRSMPPSTRPPRQSASVLT